MWHICSLLYICQQNKYIPRPPLVLLQPIPRAPAAWKDIPTEDIAMGFIMVLPAYHGHLVIKVVIDRFSKAAHFVTLPHNFSTCQAADLFTTRICKLHGYSKSIISGRDPIFMSRLLHTLFLLNGIKLRMSTAYQPQTNGPTDVLRAISNNTCVFVHNKPKTLRKILH